MADSQVPITAGSGTNIDTQIPTGGDHRQVVVLGDPNTISGVAPVDATLGMSVAPRRDIAAVTVSLSGLTTATTAYASGDRVGGSIFTWGGLARGNGGFGSIIGATAASQQAVIPLALYLFTNLPTVAAADNAPWTVTAGSPAGFTLAYAVGVVSFGSTRAGTTGGMITPATTGVYLPYKCDATGTSLFGVVQATGASTQFPANATDLSITLYVERY